MSGLILLFALTICFWLGGMLVRWVGQLVPNPKWQGTVKVALGLTLMASPFVDEVIGMYQFNALCKANGIESVDISKAKGKRVLWIDSDRKSISGSILPIKIQKYTFIDENTKDVLIQFNGYFARGGWVMRYLLNFSGTEPMLFDGNGCGSHLTKEIFSRNQITLIN